MTQEELRLLEERLRQVPLEELNKITIHRMAASVNIRHIDNRNAKGSSRWKTNDICVIPLEELHDSNITTISLVTKYNVNKDRIIKYRREHGIPPCMVRPKRVNNPISVIPLEELNDGTITGTELHNKYRVCFHEITKYRKEHNITYIRPKIRPGVKKPITLIPLHELMDTTISSATLSKMHSFPINTIKDWRKERGIRFTGKKK